MIRRTARDQNATAPSAVEAKTDAMSPTSSLVPHYGLHTLHGLYPSEIARDRLIGFWLRRR